MKINISTRKIISQTKMLLDNGGQRGLYVGSVIWGSSRSIKQFFRRNQWHGVTLFVERSHRLQLSCVLMFMVISIVLFLCVKN